MLDWNAFNLLKLAFKLLFGVPSPPPPLFGLNGTSSVFCLFCSISCNSFSSYSFCLFSMICWCILFLFLCIFSSLSICYFLSYSILNCSSPSSSTSLLQSFRLSSSSSFCVSCRGFDRRSLRSFRSISFRFRTFGVMKEMSGSPRRSHSVVYLPRNCGKCYTKQALMASNSSFLQNLLLRQKAVMSNRYSKAFCWPYSSRIFSFSMISLEFKLDHISISNSFISIYPPISAMYFSMP